MSDSFFESPKDFFCSLTPENVSTLSENSVNPVLDDISSYFAQEEHENEEVHENNKEQPAIEVVIPKQTDSDEKKPKSGILDDLLEASENTIRKIVKERLPNVADSSIATIVDAILFKQKNYQKLLIGYTSVLSESVLQIMQQFLQSNKGWGNSENEERFAICKYASDVIRACNSNATMMLTHALEKVINKVIGELDALFSFSLVEQKTFLRSFNTAPTNKDIPRPVVLKHHRLPKAATAMMEQWCLSNQEHPYPSEAAKRYFSQQTGLTMLQVSNFFINWRVRKWKNNPNNSCQKKQEIGQRNLKYLKSPFFNSFPVVFKIQ